MNKNKTLLLLLVVSLLIPKFFIFSENENENNIMLAELILLKIESIRKIKILKDQLFIYETEKKELEDKIKHLQTLLDAKTQENETLKEEKFVLEKELKYIINNELEKISNNDYAKAN